MGNSKPPIYVTYLPDDHKYDWRIHIAEHPKEPGRGPLFLTHEEFDAIIAQHKVNKLVIGKGDGDDIDLEVHNPDE